MPLIDLDSQPLPSIVTDCDVVIIGAGAAGIFLAHELSKKGAKVAIIESGNKKVSEFKQSLNSIENTGKLLGTAFHGRNRAIGGTTRTWGGQSLPFSSLDFSKRDWVPESGWPIDKSELEIDYHKANAFMGVDGLNYKEDIFRLFSRSDLFPADETDLDYHYSKWAPESDFYKLYRKFLASKTLVLFNAQLTRIVLNNSKDKVTGIEVSNFSGGRMEIKVPCLVVAAGGLETVRILLSNSSQIADGLGNHSGWLGKCFMEHPCLEVGKVVGVDSRMLQEWFAPRVARGRKYSVRVSPTAKWQLRNRLLNISASVMFSYDSGFDPYQEVRSILRQFRLENIGKVLSRGPMLLDTMVNVKLRGWLYKPNAVGTISLMCEQEPMRGSYLVLSERRDMFDIPLLSANWDISARTWETCVKFSKDLRDRFDSLGLGRLELRPEIFDGYSGWKELLADVNHHMGGARMSSSPEMGVVDKHLSVWGIPNLFICSTAVFPTSSHSNPTLTLLALTSKLARYILRK